MDQTSPRLDQTSSRLDQTPPGLDRTLASSVQTDPLGGSTYTPQTVGVHCSPTQHAPAPPLPQEGACPRHLPPALPLPPSEACMQSSSHACLQQPRLNSEGLKREGAITAAIPLQKPVASWQHGARGHGNTWVQGQASPRPGSVAGGRHSHLHAGCCWGRPSLDQTGAGSDRTTTSSDRTGGASDGTPPSSIQTPALGAAHAGLKLLAPIAGRPCLWTCPHAARLAPQPQALP